MKKQILFLAMITLAFIFAGTTKSFGQMRPSTLTPTPLTNCTPSPLNPMAGQLFTYSVENPNSVATGYTWWATKNPNFIDLTSFLSDTTSMLYVAPGELISTGANYGGFQAAGNTMDIEWTADILAATQYQGTPDINATPATPSPTFVVVQADGSCNNNLQVFELNPLPSFTLDIANIDPADTANVLAYGTNASQCVDIVRSAIYSATVLTMDYGTDTLLFEVVAANYVQNWIPTFEAMGGLAGDQTAAIGWAYTKADALNGNFIDGEQDLTGAAVTGTTALAAASGVNTSLGTSIFVRIVIDNNTTESIAQSDFILAVDGVDANGQPDIDQTDATCTATLNDREDKATHEITPRPDISDTTGDGAINSTPDDSFVTSPRN